MPNWNLDETQEGYYHYGKVLKSYVGPPSEDYIKAAGARARNLQQWHIVQEVLEIVKADGSIVERTTSQNLPDIGSKPQKGSPLVQKIADFTALGFPMHSEEDFPIIEGHIFYFWDMEKEFGTARRSNTKRDDWPVQCADATYTVLPLSERRVIEDRDSNPGSTSVANPWDHAATVLSGMAPGNDVLYIMQDGKVSGVQDIMNLANSNKLMDELVKRGLGVMEKGRFLKGTPVSSGTPVTAGEASK